MKTTYGYFDPRIGLSAGNVGAIASIGSIPPRVGQAALKLSFLRFWVLLHLLVS